MRSRGAVRDLVEEPTNELMLSRFHRDPFDRLLVAQARVLGVPVLTAGDQLAAYQVEIVPVL